MIARHLTTALLEALEDVPAVALLGPRQSGKTTLALEIGQRKDAVYLDLESEADRARLAEPELYLAGHAGRLVILDEVHRAPGLFPVLRGIIDRRRRAARRAGARVASGAGQFLLLGSASLDLLKQSGESLAGRIAFFELGPFDALEAAQQSLDQLWLRGGFPDSLLARDAGRSLRWRQDFLRTYLERDIPQFGPRIPAETLRRFWSMLAHQQGSLLNTAQFARGLGVDGRTAAGYLDLLVDLLLVRRLQPWYGDVRKRLVKSPKVYVRDSGLVHALLSIPDAEALFGHPVLGPSWEGFVLENLAAAAPRQVTPHFYRTGGGAEIDLLLAWPDGGCWAIEVKRSLAPKLGRGFHAACADLTPRRKLVVYPGTECFPLGQGVEAVPLRVLMRELRVQ